jgi:uncharacterized protein (TIGR02265 family)
MSLPAPPPPRLVKHVAIDSLLRAVGGGRDSRAWAEAVRLCGDGHGSLAPEVEVERYGELLHVLARMTHPGQPDPVALRRLGAAIFDGYRQTLLGQVQLAALSLAGAERLMRRIPDYLGRSSNFGERSVEQKGPRDWRVHLRGVPLPGDYYLGLLDGMLRATGVERAETGWEQVGPEAVTLSARW